MLTMRGVKTTYIKRNVKAAVSHHGNQTPACH